MTTTNMMSHISLQSQEFDVLLEQMSEFEIFFFVGIIVLITIQDRIQNIVMEMNEIIGGQEQQHLRITLLLLERSATRSEETFRE